MFAAQINSSESNGATVARSLILIAMLAVICLTQMGCQITTMAQARRVAEIASWGSPREFDCQKIQRPYKLNPFTRLYVSKPKPSERTRQLLHSYNLLDRYESEPEVAIKWIIDSCRNSGNLDEVHALAELALLEGSWQERQNKSNSAVEMYAVAMVHAYQFLFDPKLDVSRNAYDPQFRSICDIYNDSLANLLRLVCECDGFNSGMVHTIGEGDRQLELDVQVIGRWSREEFERFELANDYRLKGIENRYQTFGLGVPLIAIRKSQPTQKVVEQYYPDGLTLPMTAFCQVETDDSPNSAGGLRRAVLKLYDPLEVTSIVADDRRVPLQSDITTPLGYRLSDPLLNTRVLSTASMINANLAEDLFGLYMLEPYDPTKIPVIMVHGLWSSPVTWAEMFNDLRADAELRQNYQFWFYSYPTGQPFWFSARQFRDDLVRVRKELDPDRISAAWDEMVLVGHSMGGLISRLQTTQSRNDFWSIISDRPFEEVKGERDTLDQIYNTFFFKPDPAIQRVITIGTPHKGSNLANMATRWIGEKVFTLPTVLTSDFRKVVDENRKILQNTNILTTQTSIDSLSPDSLYLKALNAAEKSESVIYHNVVGNEQSQSLLQKTGLAKKEPGDGVVPLTSAKIDDAASEIEVIAEHTAIHRHPQTILEVRRILLEHLLEQERITKNRLLVLPASFQEEPGRQLEFSRGGYAK